MGHKYLGVEIRPEEVERIKGQQVDLNTYFDIICADSTKYDVESGKYNFSYSCPPYYDLEVYSPIDGDMSNVASYDEFLQMLKSSLQTTYNALQPDSLAIWVVGNFRDRKGYMRHFNGDTVRLAQEVGFRLWDELIFWGAAGIAAQRAGQFVANRKSVRVHEYILIFKKPGLTDKPIPQSIPLTEEKITMIEDSWKKSNGVASDENPTPFVEKHDIPPGIPEWMY